ncbi:MAG: glycosyl hydrolase-related protein [Victivallales bacterium]|jgi:alpha-mannosidase|nr:glycosyl hydrolase-related protein [Victivallales bacterium]
MQEKVYLNYVKRACNFFERIKEDFFAEVKTLDCELRHSKLPVPYADRLNGSYRKVVPGDKWGELWESAWIKLSGEIPASWAGKEIAFKLSVGGEALLFDKQGVPEYSFTNTSVYVSQYRKEIYPFIAKAQGGEKIDRYLEVGANGLFGDEINPDSPSAGCEVGVIRTVQYGVFRRDVWLLHLDIETLLGVLCVRNPADPNLEAAYPRRGRRAVQVLNAINESINAYADNPDNAVAARACLAEELSSPATSRASEVTAVGHAHIDTGWLWPVRETIRKCDRTFASQIKLLEKYPDYVFGASHAQHYAYTKEHYPELYAKIKAYVAEGRWEIQGGMWSESDCNLISGESMVRQFVHGKNFFMDEFGFEVKNLWLPDVFGYSGAMPQIIKKSDCDYFLTQKISWSQFNKFPFHSFMWRGIDNTEILTHFPPEDTYNTLLTPDQLNYGDSNYTEGPLLPGFLSLFGVGDGGGGPKEEFIERGLRCANLEGSPKVKFGRADAFFEMLNRHKDKLPTWVGELYLELHRGTLTSQSKTKQGNRRCEEILAATEFIWSCLPPSEYPATELDKAWKTLLVNQFHDIIPGSSIREVYVVTEAEHAEILKTCNALIERGMSKLGSANADQITVVNTLSTAYANPLRLPDDWQGCQVLTSEGVEIAVQQENDGLWALGNFPGFSFTVLKKGANTAPEAKPIDNGLILENELVRYEFDQTAHLIKAYDKEAKRDILAPDAQGNSFTMYVDIPNAYDAWDVDFFYEQEKQESPQAVKAERGASGAVRQVLKFELTIGNSIIRQEVVLSANSKRLDFNTEVDWQESKRMLRVSFPTSVIASEASFDIQYGMVKRPTHRNTSWDFARFEVAGHKYMDLSDHDYGVALLNDCKYGHKVLDNTLDLNLLRSTNYPDYAADRGLQCFSYALLPHVGSLIESSVMTEAAAFNRPALVLPKLAAKITAPCRLIESNGVIVSVVKKAEKSDDTVIRLVETNGRAGTARLALTKPDARLVETNLIEWSQGDTVAGSDGKFEVTLKPFEIKTYFVR